MTNCQIDKCSFNIVFLKLAGQCAPSTATLNTFIFPHFLISSICYQTLPSQGAGSPSVNGTKSEKSSDKNNVVIKHKVT